MKNHPILRNFMNQLIDYAGLFPPASLPLNEAIRNYVHYINSENAWMLGPFILPITKLNEVIQYEDSFSKKKPLKLSVVGRKSESEEEWLSQLTQDIKQLTNFKHKYSNWSQIEAIEVPLPPGVPTQHLLNDLISKSNEINIKAFCEVNLHEAGNWQTYLIGSFDAIAKINSENKEYLGVKLRTGGVKAEMIPDPKRIAFALAACCNRNLPIKFTAGLHHPIRMYRNEVAAKMHGFLNVFLAGMLAYQKDLDLITIEKILVDEGPSHFTISEDFLAWGNLSLTPQQINQLRINSLCSFGCCSFDEPKDELQELSNQQEVIK